MIAVGVYLFAEGRSLRGRLVAVAGILVGLSGWPSRKNLVFGIVTIGLRLSCLGRLQGARSALEDHMANHVDDVWTHETLCLIAASTGDRALLDCERLGRDAPRSICYAVRSLGCGRRQRPSGLATSVGWPT
jgi:hypothetical protein